MHEAFQSFPSPSLSSTDSEPDEEPDSEPDEESNGNSSTDIISLAENSDEQSHQLPTFVIVITI